MSNIETHARRSSGYSWVRRQRDLTVWIEFVSFLLTWLFLFRFFPKLRHPYSITTIMRLNYCTAMHQRVHSAVLDKEHHIYNFIYSCFFCFVLKKQNKTQTATQEREREKKIPNKAFLFFSPVQPLEGLTGLEFKKWNSGKCFCTDSCDTRYSLLPMPLKNFPISWRSIVHLLASSFKA